MRQPDRAAHSFSVPVGRLQPSQLYISVDPDSYQSLWLDRCAAMHRVLAAQRAEE